MRRVVTLVMLLVTLCATAQEEKTDYMPEVHGTIRGKYEYQTAEGEGRFEVRNARFSLSGKVAPLVSYKAEIDLSDEGSIKMLDAYTQLKPITGLQFTIGQFRVPFTIDAHRSPAAQYFANRSFIAKQVGNVRDVGAAVGYTANVGFPLIFEAGLFNGSGLTGQKDFWTNSVNFSAKAQAFLPSGINVTLSAQKIKSVIAIVDNGVSRKYDTGIMMYDAGTYYHGHGLHVEIEYLYKHYAQHRFSGVHSVDAFAGYDIPLGGRFLFTKITPLVRYDYMSSHSDGTAFADATNTKMKLTDACRSRITSGITLSMAKPFVADIRLNWEDYSYHDNNLAKISERDKFVIEFVTRF